MALFVVICGARVAGVHRPEVYRLRFRWPELSADSLVSGLLFTVVFVLASLAPAQGETWWLLRAGQDIWQTARIPFTEVYSHTAPGHYWPNHEWLTQALFYAAYAGGGMPALAAVGTALIASAWYLSWRLMRGALEIRLILFVVSLGSAVIGWSLRPQLFSMLCLMLMCHAVLAGRLGWLPPLFLIWTNLHGAVAIGIIALGGAFAGHVFVSRRLHVRDATVLVLCLAATLASPLGIGLWQRLYAHTQQLGDYGVSEWMPPQWPPANLPFWIFAGAFLALLVARWAKLDKPGIQLSGTALALLPLALTSSRLIPFFLLAAVPASSRLLASSRGAEPYPQVRVPSRGRGLILSGAMVCAIALVAYLWSRPLERFNWKPVDDVAIATIDECPYPMYNTYEIGGALLWFTPGKPVFLDNRYDPYPSDHVAESLAAERSGVYQPLFRKHDIGCAVVPTGSALDVSLKRDSTWTRAYVSQRVTVYRLDRPDS